MTLAVTAPPSPRFRLSLGVTGHRDRNAAFTANRRQIETTLAAIFDAIDATLQALAPGLRPLAPAPPRLHALLADGLDQLAAALALSRGWDLAAPLPFGRALNRAINASPTTAAEARVLLDGDGVCGAATTARASKIKALEPRAQLFELADQDAALTALYLDHLASPADSVVAQAFAFQSSARVALAGRVMIEQSDLLIAVWDGANASFIGGTGHTVALALELGAPVVWIDACAADGWRILTAPESLAAILCGAPPPPALDGALEALVAHLVRPSAGKDGPSRDPLAEMRAFDAERWRPRSHRVWHAYRRVEALFSATGPRGALRPLTQTYEAPDAIAGGSAAGQLALAAALPGQDQAFVGRIRDDVLRRFAWADGISARLSDAYRGGMILSILFSALAVVGGVGYSPFGASDKRWMFALVELTLLCGILAITVVGQRREWHGRWFEARRVAEYFRHAPILLLLGVARPAARWPRGVETSWPEWYARHALRDLGLPRIAITGAYLRGALETLLLRHVTLQQGYHRDKAERLALTHRRLGALSESLFALAVVSVVSYLTLEAGGALNLIADPIAAGVSRLLTFLGVVLPTFGAAIAGVRYFGDFERFSSISDVTSEKLAAVAVRIDLLLAAPAHALDYARVADLAQATDDIVVSEIENWQAVFGGKHFTVPA